jgi:2-C-methyl-D-erythritol 4-phosphate cytidylyltransferase
LSVVGIVPAGGSGERLGADRPKAFVVLAGRTLLDRSLAALEAVCERVVVAVPIGYEAPPDRVTGGRTRAASVKAALDAAPEATVAVVHDAARPLATPDLVRRCVDALDGVDCAFAAARVTDTVHEGHDDLVERSLDRTRLWAAQTPQVVRADVLREALECDGTDEASLVMAAGGSVRAVEVEGPNLKITTPDDLRVAEALLAD